MTTPTVEAVLASIDTLASTWVEERDERFQRRHLERSDFDAIAATGYLRLIVPESHGGFWRSLAETGPVIIDAVRRLARGDQSVALVAAMHPAVQVFWAAAPEAEESFAQAWADQRALVFASAVGGHFWGTLASEPGSGGDIFRTKVLGEPVDDSSDRYRLSGAKHFGSGSEIVSYMITTAKPVEAELPLALFLDLRAQPWDGTAGLTITRRWDGMGMKATQSHAVMLDGIEADAWAWQDAIAVSGPSANALNLAMFSAVVASVVDAAVEEADRRLGGRELRPYEQVAWTQAEVDHWMLRQALHGVIATMETESPDVVAVAAIKAKLGMAALAESVLGNVCRAVGGGAFSASSPFATWNEDVRALGYLRPPWALGFDQLIELRDPVD